MVLLLQAGMCDVTKDSGACVALSCWKKTERCATYDLLIFYFIFLDCWLDARLLCLCLMLYSVVRLLDTYASPFFDCVGYVLGKCFMAIGIASALPPGINRDPC